LELILFSGTLRAGHYTAQCRSSVDGKWYHFNDGHVQYIQPRDVLEDKIAPYVLFYLRRDYRPASFTEYIPVRIHHDSNNLDMFVHFKGERFVKGSASNVGCNSLIQTLLACLNDRGILCVANVPWIRKELQLRFRREGGRVTEDSYLSLRNHWCDVIDLIGVSARLHGCDPEKGIYGKNFSVTSVLADACIVDETVGDGPFNLYMVNVGNGAFDPLIKDRQRWRTP